MLLKKYKINDNLNYYYYQTKKYKSFSVKIYFLLPFDKEKITIRNLLKDILLYDSKQYSSTEIINKKRELYNLKVGINSTPMNDTHEYCLTISGTNPKFFNDEEYTLDKVFEYVNELIFNPNVINNKFDDHSYQMCFNRYKIALKTALEDKNYMAHNESIEILDEDQNKFSQLGKLDDFEKITNELVYQEYQELMNSKIIISCIGDLDKNIIKNNFKKYFSNFNEFKEKIKMTPTKYQEYREKVIELKTEQSILVMNFATEVEKFKEDYFNSLIFNMLLGGDASSKLFRILREKYGYCYEVYSANDVNSGLITVYVGLDKSNIDNAMTLILKQIEDIKQGNFTKTLLNELLENEYTRVSAIYDNIQSTLSREISLYLYNRDSSLRLLKSDINKVSKESIMNFASRVKHINTVVIKSKGDE